MKESWSLANWVPDVSVGSVDRQLALKVALATVLSAGAGYLLWKNRGHFQRPQRFKQDRLKQECEQLRKKIEQTINNSPPIVYTQTTDYIQQEDTPAGQTKKFGYIIQKIKNGDLPKKPANPEFKQSNVFLPPFEQGICIDDDFTKHHRLLYNKFPARIGHLLITTKEFREQKAPVTQQDFEAMLKVLSLYKGFVFFNSGPVAGASQKHKHYQYIKTASLPHSVIPVQTLID